MKLRKFNEHSDYLDKMADFNKQISKINDDKLLLSEYYKKKIRNCITYVVELLDISENSVGITLPTENNKRFFIEFYGEYISYDDNKFDEFMDSISRTLDMLEQEFNAEYFDVIIAFKKDIDARTMGVERGFNKSEIYRMREIMKQNNLSGYGFDRFYIDFE